MTRQQQTAERYLKRYRRMSRELKRTNRKRHDSNKEAIESNLKAIETLIWSIDDTVCRSILYGLYISDKARTLENMSNIFRQPTSHIKIKRLEALDLFYNLLVKQKED